MTCSAIRDDWDPAVTSFATVAPGKPWAKNELDRGGKYLSMTPRHRIVSQRLTLTWDVTEAVREAVKEGRSTISVLIRAECTGPYALNAGYKFCGPEWQQLEYRPCLRLVSKE